MSIIFTHTKCSFFPCHKIEEKEESNFNCLFCYCPLYHIEDCGGDFIMTDNREGVFVKDCTDCNYPHVKPNYVLNKLAE